MLSDALVSAVGNVLFLLWLIVGGYIYVSLARQVSARLATPSETLTKSLGFPELIVALLLISVLLTNVLFSVSAPPGSLNTRDLVANLVLTVAVLLILATYLRLRGFDLDALAGLSEFGIVRVLATGMVLLICAYPLVTLADLLTQRFLGQGSGRQTIVELFSGSRTIEQRMIIIVLAVAIAPVAEEFVFRFFLYGVLKRYIGGFTALIVTALLFAAVHAHLPSFAPLFVLGCCFTLAYEWSGSILVSMTMHSLFNAASLFFLAFPGQFTE
jgi:membrane protease YdiL (CAAX protease family)